MRCKSPLTVHELKRYDRQIRLEAIGREGQEKIKSSSVLVIGAGALGCPVLQYLSSSGTGTIGIIDNDWVDESNLHRQILYGIKDIEKPKPLAAREKLMLNNPEIKYNIHFIRLDKSNALDLMSKYDIMVDCTDNFATRYLINDAAVILDRPVVYGALHKFSGQAIVLNYKNGPTLRCLFPEPPHPLEVPDCNETGMLGSVAGIIGSVMATEVIKIILEDDGVLSGRMFVLDALSFETQLVSFERDPERAAVKEIGEYEKYCITSEEPVSRIGIENLKEMIMKNPSVSVVDLREEAVELKPGLKTIHIPYYDLYKNLELILNLDTIVFTCNTGVQSLNAATYLRKVYKRNNVYVLSL